MFGGFHKWASKIFAPDPDDVSGTSALEDVHFFAARIFAPDAPENVEEHATDDTVFIQAADGQSTFANVRPAVQPVLPLTAVERAALPPPTLPADPSKLIAQVGGIVDGNTHPLTAVAKRRPELEEVRATESGRIRAVAEDTTAVVVAAAADEKAWLDVKAAAAFKAAAEEAERLRLEREKAKGEAKTAAKDIAQKAEVEHANVETENLAAAAAAEKERLRLAAKKAAVAEAERARIVAEKEASVEAERVRIAVETEAAGAAAEQERLRVNAESAAAAKVAAEEAERVHLANAKAAAEEAARVRVEAAEAASAEQRWMRTEGDAEAAKAAAAKGVQERLGLRAGATVKAAGENNPDASTGAPAAGSGSEKRARVDGATGVSSAGVVAAPAPVNVVDQQAAKLTFYELQQLMLPPSRRDKPPPCEKKKRKGKKKDKDPNMPKKPASAWTMYRSANLQQYQKDHCCTSREAQTALGAAWKTLGDAEKKIYTDKYDAAQEMYLKERQDYLASKEGAEGASASAAPAASGGGGAKVGTAGTSSQLFEFSDASNEVLETAAKVGELTKAMSPHLLEEPQLENLEKVVVFLKDEIEIAAEGGGDDTALIQAANAVITGLKSIQSVTVRNTTAKLDELIDTAPRNPELDLMEAKLVPLKTQLQCVQDLLKVYAHTALSFCALSRLQENEAAVLGELSAMLVKPAVKHVKEAIRRMCERMESDLQCFQNMVAGKGAEERAIYENVFKIFTGESAEQDQRDAYGRVLAHVDQMEIELEGSGRSDEGQPVSDVLELTVQFRACSLIFSDLVKMIEDDMSGVEVKQRKGLKNLYRMLEKGILKGSGSVDWKHALSPEVPVNCSKILDGVGCIFLCQTFIDMNLLVERMRSVVATLDDVHFCRIKNRWKEPTDGGWRDIMFNLIVANVVVEVQIAHAELYYAREKWGHSSYGDVRCFQEVLAFTGNEEKLSEEPDQSRNPTYDVIFSHKTDQNGFVKELIERMPDLRCFSQTDLDQTQNSWKLQWLEAYEKAKICVCVLTKEYLLSGPCCLEWRTAAINSKTRIVLAVDSPDDILASVDEDGSRCDENVDIYLHLRNGSPVLLKSAKTDQELCADIKRKLPKSPTHNASMKRVSATVHTPTDAPGSAIPGVSDEPSVDILVIVDYPAHGGGGGAIEPAKYIAPFQALKAAMDAKFVGTQARIRFHTPRSIVEDDPDLLTKRIPCLCWIAMGEEAPTIEDSMFVPLLWKNRGGGCDFAIVMMKHGAEHTSGALLNNGCADRVLWISADYTDTDKIHGFVADGKSETAAIPSLLHAAITRVAFNTERAAQKSCDPIIDLAHNNGVDAGTMMSDSCRDIPQVMDGDERLVDDIGISLSRAPSDPGQLTNTVVGVPHHSSVDLNQWPQACDLLQTLNRGRSTVHVVAVTGGTERQRKVAAWTAVESYIAVAGRFKLVVYRDADLPASSRQSPKTFDLPFDTHGDQHTLVWMDSRSEFPLEALHEAIDSYVENEDAPFPWTFILTSQSDIDDIADEFEDATEIQLQGAIGTTVNESSEDLIRIVPADPTLEVLSILDVVNAAELLNLLAAALPQTAGEASSNRGVKDYIDQFLVGEGNSVVVRGMAPNTKFLFELRNDLVDGSLDQRINKLLRDIVADDSDLGGQVWTLDKSAFVSIYPKILSQMNQLSPHQREKLRECEASKRVHVTGPAGCGKTFIALHMAVDMIEAAELSSGELSRESPILFVGKNEALCRFFVNWILQRLRKKKKTKAAKVLLSAYMKVLHSSPVETQVFGLKCGSGSKIDFVKEKVSSNHSFVIVDEAHHIFAAGKGADDAVKITRLCTNASQSLLLSDISQGKTATAVDFPPDHTDVVLKEVVRNSSRIVTASLPFCRTADLADVTCHHGVRGPPLESFMFPACGDNESSRYEKYVEGITNGMQQMAEKFPGAEMHDNLVILVPNEEFKDNLLTLLNRGVEHRIPAPGIAFVDAVKGAFSEPKRNERERRRVVLDTLDAFDGMERLFVFAVGLDSVKTTEGCCGIYRAITRAHMFVCVVQEHLKGGWLEFTATVERDVQADFHEVKERERVARDNLSIIANLDAAAAARMASDGEEESKQKEKAAAEAAAKGEEARAAAAAEAAANKPATDAAANKQESGQKEMATAEAAARKDEAHAATTAATTAESAANKPEEAATLVIKTSVWSTNLNSEAFHASETINELSFDPFSNHDELVDVQAPTLWKIISKIGVVVREGYRLSSRILEVRFDRDEVVTVIGQKTLDDEDQTERMLVEGRGWVSRFLKSTDTVLLEPIGNGDSTCTVDDVGEIPEYTECVARLKHGASLNVGDFRKWIQAAHKEDSEWIKQKDAKGDTLLAIAWIALVPAAAMDALITIWPGIVAEKDKFGRTVLNRALKRKRTSQEVKQVLISVTPNALVCEAFLLQDATFDADAFLVWFDLNKETGWLKEENEKGETLLQVALANTYIPDCVVLEIISACPNAVEKLTAPVLLKNTFLHFALEQGASEAVIDALMTAIPNAVSELNSNNSYPLHLSLWNGAHEAISRKLLEAYPDAAKMRNNFDNTPLYLALCDNLAGTKTPPLLILSILAANPDAVCIAGMRGTTPDQVAVYNQFSKSVVSALDAAKGHATHAIVPGRTYKVACVGSARIPVDPGEQLLLSVVTVHRTERVLVTSAGRPDIRSFMAEYLHEVEFEGDVMSFVNFELGARLTYKFAFENSTAANDFMQDLPAEIIERYSTFSGVDDDEGAGTGTKEYTIVPSVEMCFVAKYIKAFYSEGQVMTGRGELVTIPKNIDRLLTREEAEEWPPKLPFDPCADGNEVLQYFEMLMGDDTLVQQGVLSFSRKQQFDFFVNLLFRRFQAFETTQFIIRQKDSTGQSVAFWGSTLFTQFVKEAVIMCTENFEFALDSWRSKNYSFLIREADPYVMGFTLLYPPPTYADEDTFEACCRGTRIAEIVRGDEEEMKRLTQKEALIKKLSRALGLNSDVVNDVISKRQFVLTPEIVLKLILIHERKLARCAMIIEGETGVGKTFPLEEYSDLINEAAKQDRQRDDSPVVASKAVNISAYDNVHIEAAEVTKDDSHLRANRSEQLSLKTETWAWSEMNIKRFDGATGTEIDLGRHHGRLRMDPGDRSVAFFFEFQKLQKVDSTQQEEATWERVTIHPYSDIPGKAPSEIVDIADEYMFKIRGYGKEIVYGIWPKKNREDADSLRPPYSEKKKWMAKFQDAYAKLEEYNDGRGKGDPLPIKAAYNDYRLHVKKGKEGADDIDRRFVEFHGTIEKAIYAKKKSPKFGYDNRLLELLVEVKDGQTYAIIRYRNDEHSTEINGYIDLGADGDKDEEAWKECLEDLVPPKENRAPTRAKIDESVAKGKKGRIIPGKEGVLTLLMKDRRRGGTVRKYEFEIPGGQAGAEFYERALEFAADWKVKKLASKDAPAAFG